MGRRRARQSGLCIRRDEILADANIEAKPIVLLPRKGMCDLFIVIQKALIVKNIFFLSFIIIFFFFFFFFNQDFCGIFLKSYDS